MKMSLTLLLLFPLFACGGKHVQPNPKPAEVVAVEADEEPVEVLPESADSPVGEDEQAASLSVDVPAPETTPKTPDLPQGWPGDSAAFRACLYCGCAGASNYETPKVRICVSNKSELEEVKRETAKNRYKPKSCRRRFAPDRNPKLYAICDTQ